MMLDPLDRPGVIEAIEGPAEHFGLVIDPDRNSVEPGETTLAEFMSHDLFDTLADPQTEQESPIAPTLQILLTRMWKEANDPKRLRGRPTFDRALVPGAEGEGLQARRGDPGAVRQDRGGRGPARGGREGAAAGPARVLHDPRGNGRHAHPPADPRPLPAPARGAARCPARSLPEPLPAGSRGGGRGWHPGLPSDPRHAGAAAPRAVPRLPRPGPACPPRARGAGGDLERPAHRPGAGPR